MSEIAIFGATFDPPTSAHLEIIKYLSEHYDEVIVIPTTVRYYKENKQMFSFNERLNMIKSKVGDAKNIYFYDVERNADEHWRFYDSLMRTKELYTADTNFTIAMGADSYLNFKTWSEWETILKEAKLLVFKRPGYDISNVDIPAEIVEMDNPASSSALRKKISEYMSDDDFDTWIDDLSFNKVYDDNYTEEEAIAMGKWWLTKIFKNIIIIMWGKTMKKALAIIDCQNDFIDGSMGVGLEKWKPAKNEIYSLINTGDYENLIFTTDDHPANHCSFKDNGGQWASHCVVGTEGNKFGYGIAELIPNFTGDVDIISKGRDPNKEEYGVDLLSNEEFKDIEQVDIVGLCYDYCVAACAKMTSEAHKDVLVRVIKKGTVAIDENAKPDFGKALLVME